MTEYSENITGNITYGQTEKIRIYIKWNDDINNNMSNVEDTNAASNNSQASIKTNIHFSQIN